MSKNKSRVRNNVKTFRIEGLHFAGPGLNEDTIWKLEGVRNTPEEVESMMDSDHPIRVFECTPSGRVFICQNYYN